MSKFSVLSVIFLSTFSYVSAEASGFDFKVSNPAGADRCRMVEVGKFPKGDFILYDGNGKEVAYQITHDGKLIFISEEPAGSSIKYKFKPGTPAQVDTVCYGRVFPERKDDLAWENDRAAYRAFGPALQASGERAYGYDIWTKSVDYPILEKRFHDDIVNKISFHVDHGNGMDVYAVGPTLGGGTSAIIAGTDSIVYPWCWQSAEILDNGPLRFCARLTYPPCVVGGDTIIEKRLITLDAGSWLNKTTVSYEGLDGDLRPAAGIVVHDSNPEGFRIDGNIVSYCDLTQNPDGDNGEIYVGLISTEMPGSGYLPLRQNAGDAIGHVMLIGKPGQQSFTYYWGSGWSKGGVKDFNAWNKNLSDFKKDIEKPLVITTK